MFILISMCCAPAISLCAQAFNFQDKLSMKSLKLSSSEDGKGLVIEDFNLFKSNAVDQLMTASGIQAKADPESIIRSRADSFYAIFKAKKVVALP